MKRKTHGDETGTRGVKVSISLIDFFQPVTGYIIYVFRIQEYDVASR